MCHGFTWIYVLCGHPNLSHSSLLLCQRAILTGQDCLPCIGLDWFPLKGFCPSCRKERKRERKHLRRQTARSTHTSNEQDAWKHQSHTLSDAEIHFQAKSWQTTHDHSSDRGSDDWFEGDGDVEYSQGSCDLNLCEVQSKYAAVEKWLHHQDHPSCEISDTSSSGCCPGELRKLATVHSRRSGIPVPVQQKAGLQAKTRNYHSQIPVPVYRTQKQKQKQSFQPHNELQVLDESDCRTCVDEMDFFDQITF